VITIGWKSRIEEPAQVGEGLASMRRTTHGNGSVMPQGVYDRTFCERCKCLHNFKIFNVEESSAGLVSDGTVPG
jgi:hypothetical protein